MVGMLVIAALLLLIVFLAMKLRNVLFILFLVAFLMCAVGSLLYAAAEQPLTFLLILALFASIAIPQIIRQIRRENERRRRVDAEGNRIWLAANAGND